MNRETPLPIPEELPPHWMVAASPDLYLSPRDGKVLVVEPESASWDILDDKAWEILARLLGRSGDAANTSVVIPGPVTLGELLVSSRMEPLEFNELILRFFRSNLVSINGKLYYEPSAMWGVQDYPHYFNIHMTEACNLGCTYCRIASPETALLLKPDVARRIVRRVIQEIPLERILLSFHGGEPLLNMAAIAAAAEEATTVAAACGKQVDLMVQTNGTLLTKETVEQLKKLKVPIGVSLDGPAPIHDRHRVDRKGQGSYERVAQGIRTAAELGSAPGLLSVVHDPAEYAVVVDHLARAFQAMSLRVNFSAMEGRAAESMDFPVDRGEAFARQWLGLIDYAKTYCEETNIWLDIADLNLFLFHLISKCRPHMCYRSPCGAGNSILAFGADGRIYLCDELVGEADFCIGSIQDELNLKEMLDGSQITKALREARRVEKVPKCARCPWRRFHGSGCANKSYRYFGHTGKEDPMCRFYSVIFEELMWRVHRDPSILWLCNSYAKSHMGSEVLSDIIEAFKKQGSTRPC